MDTLTHAELVRKEERGELLIGVEPSLARRFFSEVKHDSIAEQIGEPVYIETLTIKLVWILQLISLVLNIVLSIPALAWYSIATIPITVFLFGFYQGKASMATQRVFPVLGTTVIFMVCAYLFTVPYSPTFYWIVTLPLPFLFVRLTYKFSTVLLRYLCIRNEKAFKLLHGHTIFIKEVQ